MADMTKEQTLGQARPALPPLPTEKEARLEAVKVYWQRYYQVTLELKKYLEQNDIDAFLELGEQRLTLGECIMALEDAGYRSSDECQKLISLIRPLDEEIIYAAKRAVIMGRKKKTTARAYEPSAFSPVGNILNLKK